MVRVAVEIARGERASRTSTESSVLQKGHLNKTATTLRLFFAIFFVALRRRPIPRQWARGATDRLRRVASIPLALARGLKNHAQTQIESPDQAAVVDPRTHG